MAVTGKTIWLGIDVSNPAELEAMRSHDAAEASRRTREAVAELKRLGIADGNGRRIKSDVTDDMREDSPADMSSL